MARYADSNSTLGRQRMATTLATARALPSSPVMPESRLWIAGAYADPRGDSTPVNSPVTGEKLADLPRASTEQLDAAVAAAQRAWADAVAGAVHGVALADVEDAASLFSISAEDAKRLYGETIPSSARNKRMFTYRAPVGVWAAITPWNFPLMIMCEFLGPALATGNAIVCKPPDTTPLACLALGALLEEAGVPTGLVSIIPGDGAVGEHLVTHAGVDAIGFVGSSTTAERIVRAAGLKRSLMEASGNGPVVVCADADLTAAAEAAVFGAYWNAGQVCCATERVLVDRHVASDFADAVVEAASAAVLGDPFDDATTMGPLANAPTAAKMDAHITDAVERGAQVRLGGGRASGYPTDLYYEFTVVDGVDSSMRIAREESFGPVVPIVACDDDAAMLTIANADPLGLQAAVFTKSLSRAFTFAEGLRCGSVVVNDSTDYFESAQPFGGAGGTRTGWGRVGGLQLLRDMTDLRCTIISLDEK